MEERISALLRGAIDLHCHSGPSVMPRGLNHVEAIRQGEEAGLRAILFKDHYYSVTPIAALLEEIMPGSVKLFTGVPLNNTTGGFNPYAVEHGFKLGARLVCRPFRRPTTFASRTASSSSRPRKKCCRRPC